LSRLSADHDYEAEIHGSITAYQSSANFVVNGIPVNASSAQITGALAVGVQVEVEGSIRAGQLVATQVAVRTALQVETQEFEFYGVISNVTAQTFVVRGETFYYDSNTSNSDLLTRNPLPYVEVKAHRINGRWQAIEIDLED
jgi:spore germination cell wall hydrolase CwlJ-like protein